jgi:hypothetical protein
VASLVTLCSGSGSAQGTAPVPIGDVAYVQLDRLVELGVVEATMGQRPYSRREFGRLLRSAQRSLFSPARPSDSALAQSLIARLEARFADSLPATPLRLLDEVEVSVTTTDAIRRSFPGNTGASLIEATIDPLALRRLGEPVPRGSAVLAEFAHGVDPFPWLSFHLRERLAARSALDTSTPRLRAEVLLASARLQLGNVAVGLGRDRFVWAREPGTGLFLASDAPALDQVSITGDRPFELPGPLRRLGPTQATLIIADMGASSSHSHSRLVTYKVSVRPSRALELGGVFQNHFGGAGSVPAPLRERIFDLLPFLDIFRRHNYTDSTRALDPESNKVLGMDMRWRIDRLGGLIVAGEWLIDDFDVSRLRTLLGTAGSHSLSITFPRLRSPAFSATLSARHMGIETYAHARLTNGVTTRGRLLGDELGPNAKAFGARFRWMPSAAVDVTVDGRSAIYSDADYFICPPPGGCTSYILKTIARRPDELREQLIAAVTLAPSPQLAVSFRAGGERVRNQIGLGGVRFDYVTDVGVRWRP